MKRLLVERLLGCVLIVLLAGCTAAKVEQGQQQTHALPAQHGWDKLDLSAAPFTLTAFAPPASANPADRLVIYLEGDGLAWLTPDEASDDPRRFIPSRCNSRSRILPPPWPVWRALVNTGR